MKPDRTLRSILPPPPGADLELSVERRLRELAPVVLGALVRRHGQFDACEDAVQEALLAAAQQWTRVPEHPRAWLETVASRRLVDEWRSVGARRAREEADARAEVAGAPLEHDDSLTLLFLCCHPALSAPSQLALTLRAVGGLTTAEVAAAFLVPESTMAQRGSRVTAAIRAAGARFEPPSPQERPERLAVVLHVLALLYNEGYTPGAAERSDLAAEALRLARMLHRLLPEEGEAAGLLALLLLTDARRAARTTATGALVPLAEQDRTRWDAALIGAGVELLAATVGRGAVGPFQLQAAIAALHAEAASDEETDWPQILALYELLERVAPNPVVTLNRAVALARVRGPRAGLALLATLDGDAQLARTHRLDAVRGHLLEQAGEQLAAQRAYRAAAGRTPSRQEREHLALRAAALDAL